MSGRGGTMPLRPLGTAELLDSAVRLVRRNARIAFTFAVPVAVLRTAADLLFDLAEGSTSGVQPIALGSLLTSVVFGTFLTGLLSPVFAGDVIGERVGGRAALRRIGRRWWPLVVLSVVAGVSETAGLVALVVGGVWLWGVWAVAAPAMIVEGTGVRRSLGRSIALVRTNFWRVWGRRALGWLLTYVLGLFVQLPFLVVAAVVADANPFDTDNPATGVALYVIVTAIGGLLSLIVTGPLTSAIDVLIYLDLRMRREGMDIALALSRRSASPAVSAW